MSDFRFYQLNRDKAAGLFADLDDLADWLDLFEERRGELTTEEIETDDGEISEIVLLDGEPIGVAYHPASPALLKALQSRRALYAIAAE